MLCKSSMSIARETRQVRRQRLHTLFTLQRKFRNNFGHIFIVMVPHGVAANMTTGILERITWMWPQFALDNCFFQNMPGEESFPVFAWWTT